MVVSIHRLITHLPLILSKHTTIIKTVLKTTIILMKREGLVTPQMSKYIRSIDLQMN